MLRAACLTAVCLAALVGCENTQPRAGVSTGGATISATGNTQGETDEERLLRFKRQTQRDQMNEYFRHQHRQKHAD